MEKRIKWIRKELHLLSNTFIYSLLRKENKRKEKGKLRIEKKIWRWKNNRMEEQRPSLITEKLYFLYFFSLQ